MAGRTPNEIETKSIQVSLTAGVRAYLSDLLQTHLYGKSHSTVAERLIERGIQAEIEKGTIQRRTFQREEG